MIVACWMFKIQVSTNSAAESFFLKLPFYFEKCDLHCLSSKYSDTRHQLQSITCTSCLIYLDLKSSCFTILSAVCLMNFCLMHFFAKKTSISFSLSLSLSLIINVVLLIRGRRTFWEGFMFVYTVLQLKIFFFVVAFSKHKRCKVPSRPCVSVLEYFSCRSHIQR